MKGNVGRKCLGFANGFGFNAGKPQVLVKEEEEYFHSSSTAKKTVFWLG